MAKRIACDVHYYVAPEIAPSLPCPYPYCEGAVNGNEIVVGENKWLRWSLVQEYGEDECGPRLVFIWILVGKEKEGGD